MLHSDTTNPSNSHTNTLSKSLLAFKPRQVLLAQHNPRSTMTASALKDENSSKITSLTPELKRTLHQSILHYLHRNGFSKTLKRFQSEAQVQSDAWKASSLHLEDVFCKYNPCNVDSNKSTSMKPVLGNEETIKKDNLCATNEEITKKKKKKSAVEINSGANKDQSEVTDKKIIESAKNCSQTSEDIIVNELETKSKKKKKIKPDFDSSAQAEEAKSDASKELVDDLTKKAKDKKKKGIKQDKLGPSTTNEIVLETEVAQKERKKTKKKSSTDSSVQDDQVNSVKTDAKNETIQSDVSRKEKKSSKKRKRSLTDDDENLAMEMAIIEEFKHQKAETSEEKKSKKEGNKAIKINAQETSNEQLDGHANGKLEINGGENSGAQKSTKKQRKDSTEPKTVNAFQRVKVDQVEFAHEKLQDNSYWAKDGADVGYGAKAQEVLGQVRGRDFRHEKTKKKRGSYRGGLIDLQSHSVKFNYSDDE